MPEIFKDIHEAYEQIDARLKAEQFKVKTEVDDFSFIGCRVLELIVIAAVVIVVEGILT